MTEKRKKKKINVFVYKESPSQFGNGLYCMVACFLDLNVHVPFTIEAHSENEYLKNVGKAISCDGSCGSRAGHTADFSVESAISSNYSRMPIVNKAKAFSKKVEKKHKKKND
jgi:hypothetical protein